MTPGLVTNLAQHPGISVNAFYNAFKALLLNKDGRVYGYNPTIGIAVSGGVDSMALAKLCSMIEDSPISTPLRFYFHAYVVDHKAREGSGLEASQVKSNLLRLGISASILDLKWPSLVRPLLLPDFETQARRLRYQALGAACRAKNINRLLIAHHADDQAETVLMRLATGQKGGGLRGMHQCTDIPECWGMHGIDKSGYHGKALPTYKRKSDLEHLSLPPLFEAAGIVVLRPLLNFFKRDLIDTCIAHNVAWVEDETNKDTWRTPRNGARYLLNNVPLPRALRRHSLLKLSQYVKVTEISHYNIASRVFRQSKFEAIDLRSGRIVIRLPRLGGTEDIFQDDQGRAISRKLALAFLVRRLATLVTPQEEVSLSSLQSAAPILFPEFADPADTDPTIKPSPTKFTAAGVQFERIQSPNISIRPVHAQGRQQQSLRLDQDYSWSLSRQPFTSVSAVGTSECAEATLRMSILVDSNTESEFSQWSPWYLWDGRYWIRITRGAHQRRLRPFREADLQVIRSTLPKSKSMPLEDVLASAAPGKVRWTLPIIVDALADIAGRPKPFGLPTLGRVGNLDVGNQKGEDIEWEVRYKEIDLGLAYVGGGKATPEFIKSWNDS